MPLISKNTIKRAHAGDLFIVKNPKKSTLQVGDFVITNENKSNIYFVASKDIVNSWLNIKHTNDSDDDKMIFVQSLVNYGISKSYLPFTKYDDDLKWVNNPNIGYSIKYVFRTSCKEKDLEIQKGVEEMTLKVCDQLKTNFPEIAKSIHI